MILNYLKTAWRNIILHKGYSFINIFGLALGLALVILIALYVELEYSFDKFNKTYSQIHRVEVNYDNKGRYLAFSHPPLGPELVKKYPEIVRYTRFLNMGNPGLLYYNEEKKYYQANGWWAENSFFEVFSYRILKGDAKTALVEPNSIVLSADLAKKFFGADNPIGKILKFDNTFDCKVTAVVDNCPANSHIQYGYFISYDSYKSIAGNDYLDNWQRIANYTYVVLSENASLQGVNAKIRSILKPHLPPGVEMPVYLKPLSQIHFSARVVGELGPNGDMNRIRFLILIGAAIITLGCINFMNLATARSARRSREVGIRKVAGATRFSLIRQFLGESLLVTFLALIVAFILAQIFLPVFNELIGRQLEWTGDNIPVLMPWLIMTAIFIGVISSSYPALYLSSFQPGAILKGAVNKGGHSVMRKLLVVFQFIISITLIIGTWIIHKQIHYMKNESLGYNSDQVLVTTFRRMDPVTVSRYEAFKNELLKNSAVINASITRDIPSFNSSSTVVLGWEGSAADEKAFVNINYIDDHFLDTYGISLNAGNDFTAIAQGDTIRYCLLNETAARRFGWSDPIGKRIAADMYVLGVVNDFHYASLQFGIEPMILFPFPRTPQPSRAYNVLSIKLSSQNSAETVASIKSTYERLFPNDVFEYRFYDEDFNLMYRNEMRIAKTITSFSLIAICISLLGLVGLASFMAEQRTKEIGIRKIVGSSIGGIIILLSKEFTKWIIIANVIAWPIGYFIMQDWLKGFAYRTEISLTIFVFTGILALILALLTVAYQSIKAALADPVESLRYE